MALPEDLEEALASWVGDLRTDAERDGWAFICALHGYEGEDVDLATIGPRLVERLIEAVAYSLAMRFMHAVVDQAMLDEALRFVACQAYGLDDADRGAKYSLRFLGTLHEVELFVPRFGLVDLEDFQEVMPFRALIVRKLEGDIDMDEAEEIVRAIYEDLTYDGEPWELQPELMSSGELVVDVREGEEE